MPWQPFRRRGKHRQLKEEEEETSFAQEMVVPRSYSDGNLVRAPSERLLLGDWGERRSYGTCSGGGSNWTSFSSYTVEEGDTLAGLSLRFNITIQDLKLANKIWTNEGLWPGKALRIPHIEAKETSLDLSGSSAASETMSTDSQVSGDSSRHVTSSRNSSLAPSGGGPSLNASPVSLPAQRCVETSPSPPHSKYTQPKTPPHRASVEDLSSFLTAMDSCIAINKKASISLIKSSKLKPDQRELIGQHSLPVDFLSNNNTSDRTRESRGAEGGFEHIC